MFLSAFGLLAALGLYGVMAYSVVQRNREIGIRAALGATRRDILRLFLFDGMRLAGLGLAAGLVLSLALTRVLSRFLFGITAADLLTYLGVIALLAGVAAAASFLPARRAARLEPMSALKQE